MDNINENQAAETAQQQQPELSGEQQATGLAAYENLLMKQRQEWTKEVSNLNEMMRTMPKLDEMMNSVYMRRQEAVDYYFSLNTFLSKRLGDFKKESTELFLAIKQNGINGIRLATDANIQKCVDAQLADKKMIIDMATSQMSYIKETISTIDNIIYGINQKVKIHEMMNGMKY